MSQTQPSEVQPNLLPDPPDGVRRAIRPGVVTWYIDGGCSGNAQHDLARRRMIAVVTDADGQVLEEQAAEGGSNNIAELIAVELALTRAALLGIRQLHLLTDSMNNLSWVFGHKVGKAINDRQRVLDIRSRIARLRAGIQLTMSHVGRDDNKAGHYIEHLYHL